MVVAVVVFGALDAPRLPSRDTPGGASAATEPTEHAQPAAAVIPEPEATAPATPKDEPTGAARDDDDDADDQPRRYAPKGEFVTLPGTHDRHGHRGARTFKVEVERGLGVDRKQFLSVVDEALFGRRGWAANGYPLRRVDSGPVDFTITLASPQTTDRLCLPLRTNGIFSCWQAGRAVLNAMRWHQGADSYADDTLHRYRLYMVNHEVGHGLGHGHTVCPSAGAPAPVMMQQTKTVGACTPNPFPFP